MSDPIRSHQDLFRAVHQHAEAILHLTETVPTDCQPIDTVPSVDNARWFLTVAYRWGQTNEHHYFVYVGNDQVKAMTLADAETQERGGKYGCAVYAFDANGVDYQLLYYSPSMMETDQAKAPTHNHKADYFMRLGMFVDQACKGAVYLPVPGDTEGVMGHKHTLVEVPQYLKDEQARAHERLQQWQRIDEELRDRQAEVKEAKQ